MDITPTVLCCQLIAGTITTTTRRRRHDDISPYESITMVMTSTSTTSEEMGCGGRVG